MMYCKFRKKQLGFVDSLALLEAHRRKAGVISFWTSPDAEEYHQEPFETIANMLKPALAFRPRRKTLTVSASIAHRIAIRRAA
jgi:hypothetical protein